MHHQIIPTSEILSAKSEKFDDNNFHHWWTQMRFWLTTLNLIIAIEPDNSSASIPITRQTSTTDSVSTPRTPQEIEYQCLHRILGAQSHRLYDISYTITSAKSLQDTLEKKYGLDDTGIKHFKASDFNKFKMIDSKIMNDQIHEFENFVQQLKAIGSTLDETFQISCLIDNYLILGQLL